MTAACFLARPSAVFRESYLCALREGFNGGSRIPMDSGKIAAIRENFDAHIAGLDNDGQVQIEEAGRLLPGVPNTCFWLVDGGEFIGAAYIRAHAGTHVLSRFGGHVGYGIRPSMRRRGYGTHLLALSLQICRGMGLGIVRIGCAEENAGSRRIIEANGGIFLRRCEPAWYAPRPYLLYEIILV